MSDQRRVWIADDGERYEASLRRLSNGEGVLIFRQPPDEPGWAIAVGSGVNLVEMDMHELETLLRRAQGRG